MLKSLEFKNFKVLRDAFLPLKPFTLIVGPNGSGKSTALDALPLLAQPQPLDFVQAKSLSSSGSPLIVTRFAAPNESLSVATSWAPASSSVVVRWNDVETDHPSRVKTALSEIRSVSVYMLESESIVPPVNLEPSAVLGRKGDGLANVLDRLRDQWPERFEGVNQELGRWLPEFDRILFETPKTGFRGIKLRSRKTQEGIGARHLSQGTLQALAILTIAYLPEPPKIVAIEEPDRGIHPRLLKEVRDALYRLSYPDQFGETRPQTQVIATTHSPYFLDLFRERTEEVVLADKQEDGACFIPLSSHEHLEEILRDTHLSEAWFSGVLGGVPAHS